MNAKISEKVKFNAEILLVTSAAGSTSKNYDMQTYDRAFIGVCITSTDNVSAVIDLMQSSAATVAGTSAAGSKAGITVGGASTLVASTAGARAVTLTMGTVSTDLSSFTLSLGTVSKTFVNTTSTALHNSSAWTTAAIYFGSTVGSTVDTGLQLSVDSLKAAIESTKAFSGAIQCSTPTTVKLACACADSAVGSIGFASTAAGIMGCAVNQAVGGFDIMAEQLASTLNKRYIAVKVSTNSTLAQAAVTVLREGGRFMPPSFAGLLSS